MRPGFFPPLANRRFEPLTKNVHLLKTQCGPESIQTQKERYMYIKLLEYIVILSMGTMGRYGAGGE